VFYDPNAQYLPVVGGFCIKEQWKLFPVILSEEIVECWNFCVIILFWDKLTKYHHTLRDTVFHREKNVVFSFWGVIIVLCLNKAALPFDHTGSLGQNDKYDYEWRLCIKQRAVCCPLRQTILYLVCIINYNSNTITMLEGVSFVWILVLILLLFILVILLCRGISFKRLVLGINEMACCLSS